MTDNGQILIGAVAYHPRVVTIWEDFRDYFRGAGVDLDFVLFSNYERQIDALLERRIDVAWHTNTAYVTTEARVGGGARLLGMRDIDRTFATVLVTRPDESFDDLGELRGRRLALGSRDSGHAAILPLHYLTESGLDPDSEIELIRFDTDLGKHGDTGDSELHVVRAVAEGEADVGAVGEPALAGLRERGFAPAGEVQVAWRSPTYYHCTFTALPDFDGAAGEQFEAALLAMDYNDAGMRPAMDLESVKRWHPSDTQGYETLTAAMSAQGLLA